MFILFANRTGIERVLPMRLALTIIHLVVSVVLLVVVLIQSGKTAGLSSAIGGGGGDTYLSRNKNKSFDARLARGTKWLAAVFVLLTLGLQFV